MRYFFLFAVCLVAAIQHACAAPKLMAPPSAEPSTDCQDKTTPPRPQYANLSHTTIRSHSLNATQRISYDAILHDYVKRKDEPNHSCDRLRERVEWRKLSAEHRQEWINATWCLTAQPSRIVGVESGLPGRRTSLLSDHALLHIRMFYNIHYVAAFLPWHRYFLHAHAIAMRDCGYHGPVPYWDWSLDADTGNVLTSPILSNELGLGGNGSYPDGTVTDGPFAYFPTDYYSVSANASRVIDAPHYLRRTFGTRNAHNYTGRFVEDAYNSSAVERVLTTSGSNFSLFSTLLEGLPGRLDIVGAGPHSAVHEMIGGDLFHPHSPLEPLFWLHHANIDRLWVAWQRGETSAREGGKGLPDHASATDLRSRMWAYGGNTVELAQDPTGGPRASLFDVQTMQGLLVHNVETYKLMDTTRPPLCYYYV